MTDAPFVAPTLEGRALCDLGQQLAAMRKERDALKAVWHSDEWAVLHAVDGCMKPGDVIPAEAIQSMVNAFAARFDRAVKA